MRQSALLLKGKFLITKSTASTQLPEQFVERIELLGEQIRQARLRQNLSVELVAKRAHCLPQTVRKVQKGDLSLSAGTYLKVIAALELDDTLDNILIWM